MPPKLLTNDKQHIVIRPLAYCQEKDILEFLKYKKYPIIPCNLCGSQENLTRLKVKKLISDLALHNPKIPSNILNAIGNVKPSQLMDHRLWDFKYIFQYDRPVSQLKLTSLKFHLVTNLNR